MEPETEPMSWSRIARFAVLAAAAAFVIYALGPRFEARTAPLKKAADRRALADFELPAAAGGGQWRLSGHRGEVLLLNFWATWCPPCRAETPELVELHEQYAGRGFQVIGISLDENRNAVPPFVARFRIPYPVLFPTEDFALASQIESLPTSILLDREGRIASVYRGAVSADTLRPGVEALLAEN